MLYLHRTLSSLIHQGQKNRTQQQSEYCPRERDMVVLLKEGKAPKQGRNEGMNST